MKWMDSRPQQQKAAWSGCIGLCCYGAVQLLPQRLGYSLNVPPVVILGPILLIECSSLC